jgi:succinylglutamic semialdehyde dehydrogenase
MTHYINGEWKEGLGEELVSYNPATGEEVWKGREATQVEVQEAVEGAKESFPQWSCLSFEERSRYLCLFRENLSQNLLECAETICKESGKPLWEAKHEVGAMIQKVDTSIHAFQERCPEKLIQTGRASLTLHHKPHGVVAVFGPFNFPGHLPNGHIVPALLAGNTVVFKGSEFTPSVSERMAHYWAALPKGVFNMVQGGHLTGSHLVKHSQIDGLFFTGSYHTGMFLLDALRTHPEKILALEMGGNNPLVITSISDLEAAAYLTVQSAFLTAGQRCTAARRLILLEGGEADAFLKILLQMAASLRVSPYTERPEPFMGPVISSQSADKLLAAQAHLGAQGGDCLLEMHPIGESTSLLTCGIMDVTAVLHRKDEELFGPFLQVIRVPSFEAALREANATSYGLCASLFSHSKEEFQRFYQEIRAGVINWNTPTTGASGKAPFGGIGKSGNHRPGGYYAADYCAYPVASMISEEMHIPKEITPGIPFLARTCQ